MTRIALALLTLVAALPVHAQEDAAALAAGQKYLEKVAAAWSAKLPREQLCGFYIGRQWVGSFTISIKEAPAPAAFEMTIKGGLSAMGKTLEMEARHVYAKNLSPVSSETSEKSDGKVEKRTLTVADGTWKLKIDENGTVTEKEGKVGPGTTIEALFLPLYALPDDGAVMLLSVEDKKNQRQFRRKDEKKDRTVDGKKEACSVLETSIPTEATDLWLFRADGTPLELTKGDAPIRVRPIDESKKGKPINEPLDLKPAERRLIDMFIGISKNEPAAVVGCFDFDRLSAEMVEDFAKKTPEEQKKAIEEVKTEISKNLLSEQMRAMFPDPALLEDAISSGMKTSVKDGVARVQVFGRQTWKLYEVQEGPKKGQWLIFGIEQ